MYRLNTLGTLEIDGLNAAEAGAMLAQPKRLALLLYLAIDQPGGWQRRDTLLGLLWGDLDESRARNALSQALHHLRRGLGAETLPGQGVDLVRVETEYLPCDTVLFERLVQERRHAEALTLYRGELAPGLHVDDAPAFEQWLDGERRRLSDLAFQAAVAAAGEREGAGDLAGALELLRRAIELRPEEEGILRRLMLLHERTGDRASALRAYEQFAARLADELEVEPSAETQSLARDLRLPVPLRPLTAGSAATSAADGAGPFPPTPTASALSSPVPWWRRPRVAALTLLALVVGVAGGQRLLRGDRPIDGSGELVAIAPFRLAGADPSLAYLREGMVDLLSAKLTGQNGPRALDPRAVLAAWRGVSGSERGELTPEDALVITQRMGARRLVLGGVVGRPDRLMISAALRDVPDGKELARASVEGPADSLPEMVDRLAGQLLALDAGEAEQRLTGLGSIPLAALRPYLAGQVAFRGGRYEAAVQEYQQALQADSTFTLAALGLAAAGLWVPTAEQVRREALAAAWAGKERLRPADRAYLIALAGPHYPAEPTARERLVAWEQALRLGSDRPDVWYEYGDVLFHKGALLGVGGAREIARGAFEKAARLDSTYAAATLHLFELLAGNGEVERARALARQILATDSTSEHAEFVRWRLGVLTGERVTGPAFEQWVRTMPFGSLWRIVGTAQLDGVGLEDAEIVGAELRRRNATRDDRITSVGYLAELALNRGRPREAARLVSELPPDDAAGARPLFDALYADGDTVAAIAGAKSLALSEHRPLERDSVQRAFQLFDRCALIQWRLWQRDTSGSGQVLGDLLAINDANAPWWAVGHIRVCGAVIQTQRALPSRAAEAGGRLAVLDSLLELGMEVGVREPGNLAAARLHEQLGDSAGALRALRRLEYHHRTGIPYLAARLRSQALLAGRLGRKEEAAAAARHYLALRSSPAPERAAVEDSIRAEMRKLIAAP
jgi:DNA-binding SARP family transcriptional activator